jgi:hypothetical protein
VIDSASFVLLTFDRGFSCGGQKACRRFQGSTVETELSPRGGVGEHGRRCRRVNKSLLPRSYHRTCCHVLAGGGSGVLESELKATSGPWDALDVRALRRRLGQWLFDTAPDSTTRRPVHRSRAREQHAHRCNSGLVAACREQHEQQW